MKSIVSLLFLSVFMTNAQLVITVGSPKVTGNKAVVPLLLKNNTGQKIESARAAILLTDEQGKLAGQATKWVGGGSDTNGLAEGGSNTFNFVISSDKPFATTNLTATINVTRIVLANGKLGDIAKDVQIQRVTK